MVLTKTGTKIIPFSLSCILLFFVWSGCEGDRGVIGNKGLKGRQGRTGFDPEENFPSSKYFGISIFNGSYRAISSSNRIICVFDSTLHSTRDTVVANRVLNSPLIDGYDGGESEWGREKSRIPLSPLRLDSGSSAIPDNHIREVTCRVAYDEDFIYLQLSWREANVHSQNDHGQDTLIAYSGRSSYYEEMYIDPSHPDVVAAPNPSPRHSLDTTFAYVRVRYRIRVDSICFPPPPAPPIICDVITDTTREEYFVWRRNDVNEDKIAVCWCGDELANLQIGGEATLSTEPVNLSGLTSTTAIDVWRWGACSTDPLGVADDWQVTGSRLSPDDGNCPYRFNWVYPDSTPMYMSRLDPNLDSDTTNRPHNSVLWYFDATEYSHNGWTRDYRSYVPGMIVTVPSLSRADVLAKGEFDSDIWVLEMKRARKTGNGDDLVF